MFIQRSTQHTCVWIEASVSIFLTSKEMPLSFCEKMARDDACVADFRRSHGNLHTDPQKQRKEGGGVTLDCPYLLVV